ncbi:MAG TPA: hypothetical protein VK752_28260 [Bryobacteraceae bacterium]|nr:hypothetical protein [Bryobacteraceae bacterium]
MPFTERFQLLDLKRDEGARTYEAREIATGRPVFVHLFANTTSPLNRAMLAKLDTLPEEERHRILDRGEHEGGIYLVTDRLAEYQGLREWLKAHHEEHPKPLDARGAWQFPPSKPPEDPAPSTFDTAPLPAMEPSIVEPPPIAKLTDTGLQTLQLPSPGEPPAVAPPPPANDPGEFTQQFAPPVLRPAPKPTPPAAAPAPPANEPGEFTRQFAMPVLRPAPKTTSPPAAPPADEPGEFTRQFAPPVHRPAPPPSAPTNPAPGEFTQLFAAPPPKPSAPPKAGPPSGEFTKLFRAPQRPDPAPAPKAAPPSAPTANQPGEFTQMLQAQRPSATPAPPSANQPPQSGEFTRFFQSPMAPSAPSQPHGAPLTPPRPPSHPKDAGEFTQIFGRDDLPSAPPPPRPAAPPNPASANATQVFAAPRPNPPIPQTPSTGPQFGQPMQQQPVPHGPGEYTQMFAKPASLTFGQPGAPQGPRLPEPAPIKRNSSRLPLLLVIGAAVLLIVALVVYFVMRPR